jgi:hypothetical protein
MALHSKAFRERHVGRRTFERTGRGSSGTAVEKELHNFRTCRHCVA